MQRLNPITRGQRIKIFRLISARKTPSRGHNFLAGHVKITVPRSQKEYMSQGYISRRILKVTSLKLSFKVQPELYLLLGGRRNVGQENCLIM